MISKTKKIGKYVVELIEYPMAGGQIKVWEKGVSRLPHIWTPNADNTTHCVEDINFMCATNAVEKYRNIKNLSDLTGLMMRN